jgi:hypothetical protein
MLRAFYNSFSIFNSHISIMWNHNKITWSVLSHIFFYSTTTKSIPQFLLSNQNLTYERTKKLSVKRNVSIFSSGYKSKSLSYQMFSLKTHVSGWSDSYILGVYAWLIKYNIILFHKNTCMRENYSIFD